MKRRRGRPGRGRAVVLGCAIVFGSAPALAEGDGTSARVSNAETEPYFFVPSLSGEWMLSLGIDSRRTDRFSGGSAVPELNGVLRLGHRWYGEDQGRLALGPYLWGGLGLDQAVGRGTLGGAGAGVSAQVRWMNDRFIYLHLALFGELGGAWWRSPTDVPSWQVLPVVGLATDQSGWRAMVGAELGFGLMGWFDPWIYGESPVWFGLEWVDLGEAAWSTVMFGVQLRFDWAHR